MANSSPSAATGAHGLWPEADESNGIMLFVDEPSSRALIPFPMYCRENYPSGACSWLSRIVVLVQAWLLPKDYLPNSASRCAWPLQHPCKIPALTAA
jgi:hypothetical protein